VALWQTEQSNKAALTSERSFNCDFMISPWPSSTDFSLCGFGFIFRFCFPQQKTKTAQAEVCAIDAFPFGFAVQPEC
jgi:hypothetical protein